MVPIELLSHADLRLIRSRLRHLRVVLSLCVVAGVLLWQVSIELRPPHPTLRMGMGTYLTIDGIRYEGLFTIRRWGPRIMNSQGGSNAFIDVQFELIGQVSDTTETAHRAFPWQATSIDEPFHIRFARIDGSLTEPMKIEWDDDDSVVSWTRDGRAVIQEWYNTAFAARLGTNIVYPGVLYACLRVLIMTGVSALVPVLLLRELLADTHWIKIAPGACTTCGYDCEGIRSTKCPECGASLARNDEA